MRHFCFYFVCSWQRHQRSPPHSSADLSATTCCAAEPDQGWRAQPWVVGAQNSLSDPIRHPKKFAEREKNIYPAVGSFFQLSGHSWPDGLIMYSSLVWIWSIGAGLTPPCTAAACTQSWRISAAGSQGYKEVLGLRAEAEAAKLQLFSALIFL